MHTNSFFKTNIFDIIKLHDQVYNVKGLAHINKITEE